MKAMNVFTRIKINKRNGLWQNQYRMVDVQLLTNLFKSEIAEKNWKFLGKKLYVKGNICDVIEAYVEYMI